MDTNKTVNTSHSVIHPTHSPPLHQTQHANCASGERTCENERGTAAAPCGGLPRASCLHLLSSCAVRGRRRRGAGKAKGTGLLTLRARISAGPPNAERNNTQSGPEKA
ncbi:Protein of unknown function [Gryllus bimaculatus]|nr:Protein of unknown function [Gryllus bimaculatus]